MATEENSTSVLIDYLDAFCEKAVSVSIHTRHYWRVKPVFGGVFGLE